MSTKGRTLKFYTILVVILILLAGAAPKYSAAGAGITPRVQAALPVSPSMVITWNGIAQRTTIQNAGLYQIQTEVYMAYVQAAVYDAVVAIQGRYQPYVLRLRARSDASVDAAVATAAHGVLVHYFPTQQTALDADYSSSLASVPEGSPKQEGIQVGQEAAAGILTLRQGDGLEADIMFSMPAPGPGVWQLPSGQTPQTPWISKLRPFMLTSPDQFRPGPPPELTSQEWAVEYNEVKEFGRANSTVRSAEQTDLARFFSTNAIVQYNTAYRQITLERGLDAVQAARLYAMGNIVGADAGIACFDAKYHYLFWRPIFAIRQGDTDGNPDTQADPTWTPLLATPNHSEYTAAHGCFTSAQAEVFVALLGTQQININLTSSVPNLLSPTRHFQTANDLVKAVINARVWGGIHFRQSVIQGANVGRKVAQWTLNRYFLPEN